MRPSFLAILVFARKLPSAFARPSLCGRPGRSLMTAASRKPAGAAESLDGFRIGSPPVGRVVVQLPPGKELAQWCVFEFRNLHGHGRDHGQAMRAVTLASRRIAVNGSSMW